MFRKLLLITLFTASIFGENIFVTKRSDTINITPKLQIFIDHTKKKTYEEIKKIPNEFKTFGKDTFDFGYIVSSGVWVKMTFENNSSSQIEKVLSYKDELVSKMYLYHQDSIVAQTGVHIREPSLKSLHYYFTLKLPAHTKETYYIHMTTEFSSTHGRFSIYNHDTYFEEERLYLVVESSFFGAMIILILYNFLLFLFSKDRVYLHYFFYLIVMTSHQSVISGFLYLFIDVPTRFYFENPLFSMILINLIVISTINFSRVFLSTKKYPKIDLSLKVFLFFTYFFIIYFTLWNNFQYVEYDINMIYAYFISQFFAALYILFQGSFNARYYVVAWGLVFIGFTGITIHHLGIYPFKYEFPYVTEVVFVLEALLFSFALAHKIKFLQQKLLQQKESEYKRLEIKVKKRTAALNRSLSIQKSLLKELHHRVKNNMQIIVSIIRLQYKKESSKVREKFKEIENRIQAMSKVHELFYNSNNLDHATTQYYIETLTENIIDSFPESYDIDINIICDVQFSMEDSIYIGLIINELLFNSFKYAFPDKKGQVEIILQPKEEKTFISLKDNGVGFNKINREESLGLLLVETLVLQQLNGDLSISSTKGTSVEIVF